MFPYFDVTIPRAHHARVRRSAGYVRREPHVCFNCGGRGRRKLYEVDFCVACVGDAYGTAVAA